jgi:hypothetical protein
MAIQVKSYNQFVGALIRKLVADTPLNDINDGSGLFTLLEAVAGNDYDNSVAILNILELQNIDALRNNDLDVKAADLGLERESARRANGFVRIADNTIEKRSTTLYPVKPAPIRGSTQIFVNDASDWEQTGELYIGRGTTRFEGPISYSSIVDNGTFYTINLDSALQKDHLGTDLIVDGQGTTNRLVTAGTVVRIPANNQSPAIEYTLLRDAVIPAGEDETRNVEVRAVLAGSQGNAGINTITEFESVPFTGARVSNTNAFSNGRDIESDDQLRNRIKSYAQTLARGTRNAIIGAVVGVSDAEENKQVASAVITEPIRIGDPSILYIDDGGAFQPSYNGQPVDVLLAEASGDEEFLQLANFPLPRPQVVNTIGGPYGLNSGMQITVQVDNEEETVSFVTGDFVNISAATLPEVVSKINNSADIFKARLTDNSTRLLLYANSFDAEIIRVLPTRPTDDPSLVANEVFKFPTNERSSIKLFKNGSLLREREVAASLTTTPFPTWDITTSGNIVISVDGTPPQDRSFTSTDFGGATFASLTLADWVRVFNTKFAGIRAEALSSGAMRIVSNRIGTDSSISIVGGTLLNRWFTDSSPFARGQTSEFELNRQNGNLRVFDINEGDRISAGVEDTKGSVTSKPTTTGNYNLSPDGEGVEATLVIVADANRVVNRPVIAPIGSSIAISDEGNNVMRITASTLSTFRDVFATTNDYIFIVNKSSDPDWVDASNTGLFKVVSKGSHTSAGNDTWIEVLSSNPIIEDTFDINDSDDIQAFFSDAYPQVWTGSLLDNPPVAPIQNVVSTLNEHIANIDARIFRNNRIRITSTTEDGGSIAIPVSVGNAELLYDSFGSSVEGNDPLVANRVPDAAAVSWFRRTTPTSNNVFLDRYTYSDLKGTLDNTSNPGVEGVDSFSEVLESTGVLVDDNLRSDDLVFFTKGNNKRHFRTIKQILSGDRVGTQFGTPKTALGHIANNDEIHVANSLQLGANDNVVIIMDEDATNKTIDIPLYRTGRINSGSQSSTFLPTNISFSADDADNEEGVDFGTAQFWSKELNNTDFKDYKIWFKARNWYVTGGVGSAGGKMLIRSSSYGPVGEQQRFSIEYPSFPTRMNTVVTENNAEYTHTTYFFGSGDARTANIVGGTVIDVTDLGSNNFRYAFSAGVDLSTVLPGDIFSALSDSGLTQFNRGQYRIKAVDVPNRTIDIYNPDGSPTGAPAAEETEITTVADIVGTSAEHEITTVGDIGGSLDGTYFILHDLTGSVAFWFDVDDSGTSEPTHGASRSVRISTVDSGDGDAVVASKIVDFINDDPEFLASAVGSTVTATNAGIGEVPAGDDGTSGFTVVQTQTGQDKNSLNGKFFILRDQDGSVAFWFDVDSTGTLEPIHGADRSVQISSILTGDDANTVAGKVDAAIQADSQFTSSFTANVITAIDNFNGPRSAPSAGTSGFTLSTLVNGSTGTPEVVTIGSSVNIFPLMFTTVGDISAAVTAEGTFGAVPVGDSTLEILKATRDEEYIPAGPGDFSQSLAYGHDPDPTSSLHDYISFHDSQTWTLEFRNTNPNFTLKQGFVLEGVAPSVYKMDTAVNYDSAETGELFKLIPTTIDNIYHHFTQPALSQLPIVAEVSISNESRRIQIVSRELGSDGAVEVVGGQGNGYVFPLIADAERDTHLGQNYLFTRIRSFPNTINPGDTIKIENTIGVRRLSRLSSSDNIDVVQVTSTNFDYRYNPKSLFLNQFVEIEISDVSASYGRPSGYVWRWQHNDSGSTVVITDSTLGTPAAQPATHEEDGTSPASALAVVINESGSATDAAQFVLTVSGMPNQGDYYTFQSANGDSFAVWFDIDSDGTTPTGSSYMNADFQIEINISSSDTPNQIVSQLATTLIANSDFTSSFTSQQTQGANLSAVRSGDILSALGNLSATWQHNNRVGATGENAVAGFPIIGVNADDRYVDVINPFGEPMSSTPIGNGSIRINPTPLLDWELTHAARADITQAVVSSGVATLTVATAHKLQVGDTFELRNNIAEPDSPGAGVGTVISVPAHNQITYSTSATNGTYTGGTIIDSTKTRTRYKIEKLGYRNLVRLSATDGESPNFANCGVAIDDLLVISGDTFNTSNSGSFRVRGVDNNSIVFENANAVEQVNTDSVPFNNTNTEVNWVSNSTVVTGPAGAFENVSVGLSVKKIEDGEGLFAQVLGMNNTPELATQITLNTEYRGSTSSSIGVSFDMENDVNMGVYLDGTNDVRVFEGDAVRINDSLFISNIVSANWFRVQNIGTFDIIQTGTSSDYKPYVRVNNNAGIAQTNALMAADPNGFVITESNDNTFSSMRKVEHVAIDQFDTRRRILYMTPSDRSYKFSESNRSQISTVGKLNYSTDVVKGTDGYLYYTGLLRTVQRVVDGFEPEADTFPGRRAVGGIIELLPPLIRRITLSIDVTTDEGVNLGEIANEIRSVIINYIDGRGVGRDVILSEIIARVMTIRGIEAATFTSPSPATERIAVSDIEKAFIEARDISIS